MAIKVSLLQVRRKIYSVKKVRREKVRPIKERIAALWDSPLAIWEPQE